MRVGATNVGPVAPTAPSDVPRAETPFRAIPAHPETALSGSRVTNVPNQDLSVWGSHAIMFAE